MRMTEADLQRLGYDRDGKRLPRQKPSAEFIAASTPTPEQIERWKSPMRITQCDTKVKTFTIAVDPVAAPRMTRRDKWLKPRRACVQKYFDYRDRLQSEVGDIPTVPDELHCTFTIAMPDSWPKAKRLKMIGCLHKQRPDFDNFAKAICDALFMEDGGIAVASQEKRWGLRGSVTLTMIWRQP